MVLLTTYFKNFYSKFYVFFKWGFIATFIGIVVGLAGTLFHFVTDHAVDLRMEHRWILFLLPIAGLIIVFLYRLLKMENDVGTNVVFLAIHKNAKITIKTAPLIFIGTILTHMCGGSSGREGAAIQLGASLSSSFTKLFRLDEKDKKILTMCGMSAAFAAIFGTPITSTVFSMEIFSVGIMYYSALLPCALSALIGFEISKFFGVAPTAFTILNVPEVTIGSTLRTVVLGIACAFLGILFCITVKKTGKYYKRFFKNAYLRVAVGGVIVITLTLLVGNFDYNGAGMNIIARAIEGDAKPEAFAMKIIFTAVTLGAGFKGGEIVPVFFAGATFGNVFGGMLGLSPSFGAGIGLSAMFCAVTNCPLTSIILCVELFGTNGLLLFVLAISISYMLSGYYGLYSSQKIIYSKTRNEYIDTNSL